MERERERKQRKRRRRVLGRWKIRKSEKKRLKEKGKVRKNTYAARSPDVSSVCSGLI
jgi:hypothetical protein